MVPEGSELLTGELASQVCFRQEPFDAYFLSPPQFAKLASLVGAERARTYRKVSPFGPTQLDLDGRDAHYWHLLVWDRQRQVLAGSLRMALSRWHGSDWSGANSYLEHCYPGLDQSLTRQGETYAEIGRTFVAMPYQRTSQALMVLMRAMGSIPVATGHRHLFGMVSYNHHEHRAALNQRFLASLLEPPFAGDLPVPGARYPVTPAPIPALPALPSALSHTQLERWLEQHFEEPFRMPLLLRKYAYFGNARVLGLSLARDFNQITEILMHCDLARLTPSQRRVMIVTDLNPVWADGLVESP